MRLSITGKETKGKDMGRNGFNDSIGTVNGLNDDYLKHFPRGVHSLLYFAYTCVRDLFIGGGYLPCKKDYKVMVFYM
jgi:hypothetical protein